MTLIWKKLLVDLAAVVVAERDQKEDSTNNVLEIA